MMINTIHRYSAFKLFVAPDELNARLMDGNYRSGRLEVRQGNTGSWGSVCITGWDINDEHAACRMLGFRWVWSHIKNCDGPGMPYIEIIPWASFSWLIHFSELLGTVPTGYYECPHIAWIISGYMKLVVKDRRLHYLSVQCLMGKSYGNYPTSYTLGSVD